MPSGNRGFVPALYSEGVCSCQGDDAIERLILDHQIDAPLQALLDGLKIEVQKARTCEAAFKGPMECFFQTLRKALGVFEINLDPDGRRAHPAPIMLNDYRLLAYRWILNVYHHTPHYKTGVPPLQKWQAERMNRF
jgi:hypothetical protein